MRTRGGGGQRPTRKRAPPPPIVPWPRASSETLPPSALTVPSRAPPPAEQPRTKSISDASGKRKRESRLCHLETAAPSRSEASERETARRQHFRSCECAPTATSDFVFPRPLPPALTTPSPRPLPRRCHPSCGGPEGGGSCCHTRSCLWSFSSCAGKMSSVLFLYWASLRFRGPERHARHTLLICIGRRPLPAPSRRARSGLAQQLVLDDGG